MVDYPARLRRAPLLARRGTRMMLAFFPFCKRFDNRLDKFKAQRADISIVYFRVRNPSAVGATYRFLELIGLSYFFTTKFAKKARRSRRDFGRVSVTQFLMEEMLKRVQQDFFCIFVF